MAMAFWEMILAGVDPATARALDRFNKAKLRKVRQDFMRDHPGSISAVKLVREVTNQIPEYCFHV